MGAACSKAKVQPTVVPVEQVSSDTKEVTVAVKPKGSPRRYEKPAAAAVDPMSTAPSQPGGSVAASSEDVLAGGMARGNSGMRTDGQWENMVASGDVDAMMVHDGGLKGLKLRKDMRESIDSDYSDTENPNSAVQNAWLEEDSDEDLAELRRQYSNTILLDESVNDLLVRHSAIHGLKLKVEPQAASSDDESDGDELLDDWLDADEDEGDFGGSTEPEELEVTVSELVEQSDWTHEDALNAVFAKAGLDHEHQTRIVAALESVEYKQGEYIVRQGEMGDKFFIIEEGEVVITRRKDEESQPEVVTHLYQGHFFGETSLRCREPRNANVQAIRGPVKVLFLSKERFDVLVDEDENFRAMIDQLVSTKRETTKKREKLAQSNPQPVRPEYKSKTVKISRVTRSGVTRDRKQVINDYVIVRKLGKGAFGVVYLTFNLSNAALNAMKVVDVKLLRRRVLKLSDEELLKEAAVMKRLQHENLVGLYEVISDMDNDKLYMVQEFVRGGAAMDDTEKNEPMTVPTARNVFRDVLKGVQYLHFQGAVHRDLKPGNIMISDDGRAKIGDFGTCAICDIRADGTPSPQLTDVRGTPAFMAPELYVEGVGTVPYDGFAVDVWALGVTLYNLVTGVPPFLANTELLMAQKIIDEEAPVSPKIEANPHLRNLIRRMLEKDPKERITVEEALKHPWITDEGTDPIIPVAYDRVNLKAEKLSFTNVDDDADVATPVASVDGDGSDNAGSGTGSGSILSPHPSMARPSRSTSTSSARGAGVGTGPNATGDSTTTPTTPTTPSSPAPAAPKPRTSITEGIGVDSSGVPVSLADDVIPVEPTFESNSTFSPAASPMHRFASASSLATSNSASTVPRRVASSGTFHTAASMSLTRGQSHEAMANQRYNEAKNQVRNLRQLRVELEGTDLSEDAKDKIIHRVRGETWFGINPESSRIAVANLGHGPAKQVSAAAQVGNAAPKLATFTIDEEKDSDGVEFVAQRLVTQSGSDSSDEDQQLAPASSLGLKRQADFVMVAADRKHGLIMRPRTNTFSVGGGARKSQLHIPVGQADDSDSDSSDMSGIEEMEDLDAVFDPLSAPVEEDMSMCDLDESEEAAFLQAAPHIAGAANPGLNLVCGSAEAQGSLSVMEDRTCTEACFAQAHGLAGAKVGLFSVFDGHAGDSTSEKLKQTLHKRLAASEQIISAPRDAFVEVFNAVDKELVTAAEAAVEGGGQADGSGSTANILMVRGKCEVSNVRTLFCANAGDCRCVLSRGGAALAMSIDHKVTRPDEVERIEAAGGWVGKSRLHGVLAVTRAFGDVEHKGKLKQRYQPDIEFKSDPLIATPEVAVEQLLDVDEFAIIACDGLWDVITSQQAVNFVRRTLTRTKDANKAAQELVQKALDNCTVDNVSAVVICFQQKA